ncbi:MAG: hypothetical protein ABSG36_07550 [Acidimicrobiales bacterium]|jgi:hypothetical protein
MSHLDAADAVLLVGDKEVMTCVGEKAARRRFLHRAIEQAGCGHDSVVVAWAKSADFHLHS